MNHRFERKIFLFGMIFALSSCAKSKSDSHANSADNFDVSLVALRPTFLKTSTSQVEKMDPNELCKVEAGERVMVLGSPVLVNSADGAHFRVSLSQDFVLKNDCKLDRGVVFAEHFRQEYVQRTAHISTPEKTISSNPSSATSVTPKQKNSLEFVWPVQIGVLTSGFGPRLNSFHEGIDLSVPDGTSVQAAAAGRISFSGWSTLGYGHWVQITHENGFETRYGDNSNLLGFTSGKVVLQGDEITKSGPSGNSTGHHIHFEIRKSGNAVDPMQHLPARGGGP
jgi:murein DD-endopeptidase MepM/ murein hydrolase activator NlpD